MFPHKKANYNSKPIRTTQKDGDGLWGGCDVTLKGHGMFKKLKQKLFEEY
jgi:hypothetical protein